MRRFLATVIGSLLVTGLPNAVLAAPEGVEQAAGEVVVSIDGCNSGSGVIIEQQGTTYSVLTLKNLVTNARATCWLVTPDGSRIEIVPDSLSVASGQANLAIVQFESDKTYGVANLGSSQKPKVGEPVYIAAFQRSLDSNFDQKLQIEESQISAWEKNKNSRHSLIYDDTALFDFQGAPVFNQKGEVMGIHGQEKSGSSPSGRSSVFLQKPASSDSGTSTSAVESPVAPWFGTLSISRDPQSVELDRPSLPEDTSESEESSPAERDAAATTDYSSDAEVQAASLSSSMFTQNQKQVAIGIYDRQREEKKGFPMALLLTLAGTSVVVVAVYSL